MLYLRVADYYRLHKREFFVSFLAIFWFAGVALGIVYAGSVADSLCGVIVNSLFASATLISNLTVQLLPVVITILIFRIKADVLIFPMCIAKGFSYGFCCFGVCAAFGNAGWLVRGLFLFSDSALVLLLLYFWCRYFYKENIARKEYITVVIIVLAVSIFDSLMVSPFLASLFTT